MNTIKKYCLAWRINNALKSTTTLRKTLNYAAVKTVGILFETHNEKMHTYINEFVKKLTKDGKQTRLLTYFDRQHNNPYNFEYEFFTDKDISILGAIQSQEVEIFIETPFDYLYCIALEEVPVFDYILARSCAKCRIGGFRAEKEKLFEMMILLNDGQEIDKLIEQTLHYTKALATN